MIVNRGLKTVSFISAIACTIGRNSHYYQDAEDLTPAYVEAHEGVIYLAGGYWRGKPQWDGDRITGLTLINPDRTWDECRIVEQGIALLIHCEYRANPVVDKLSVL